MTEHLKPIERHPLQPFLPVGAKILLLGSFPPGHERWSMEFFYPNFQNDMWRIMGLLFYGDKLHFVDSAAKRFRYEDIVRFCTDNGIAIFDTATAVRRLKDNASDKFLEVVEATGIPKLLSQLPDCRAIVTTGERATQTICESLGCTAPKLGLSNPIESMQGGIKLYRMPSSSRAYPMSVENKSEFYGAMLRELGILPRKQ